MASTIADRLVAIRGRIAAAARSVGRDPSSIRLVAVSKTFPIDAVREAYRRRTARFWREPRPGSPTENRVWDRP